MGGALLVVVVELVLVLMDFLPAIDRYCDDEGGDVDENDADMVDIGISEESF
jgi:hypothetical protein